MGTKGTSNLIGAALFGKTRLGVLALLYGRPDQARYLSEVVRAVGAGTGVVQRELARLTAAGLLRRTVQGKQVYFQANPDSPVFADLKGLVVKTAGVVDVIQASLAPLRDGVRLALIYGSIARGEETAASDIDLLVIGKASLFEVVSSLADAQETLRREVNPAVFPPAEFKRKGRAQDPFLTAVVKGPKLFVIGGERELAELVG
jgi:predicted nucleotidyltransferase